MKKTLAVLLTMGLALSFVGCGSKEAAQVAETATEVAETTQETAVPAQQNAGSEPTGQPEATPEPTPEPTEEPESEIPYEEEVEIVLDEGEASAGF